MTEKRADQILLEIFPQWSRSQIQKLLLAGRVEFSENLDTWKTIKKPGQKLSVDNLTARHFRIQEPDLLRYVSQGAIKLEKALNEFQIEVTGLEALDVGLSTGGFSDVLLQRGARKILGVDVGQGQLHSKLRKNKSLLAFDKINARNVFPQEVLQEFFGKKKPVFDLIVVDVSFISLSLLVPNLLQYLKKSGTLIVLVKPQFELSKKDLNKKGVVKDEKSRKLALEKILGVFRQNALKQIRYCDSPIEGDNGNKEFLLKASKD